ncbi:MAG: hypothetical protein M3O64_02365, partial [Chloroflexota bacterium]|nr:hypothetical protein [Chloroflexota bacterium]
MHRAAALRALAVSAIALVLVVANVAPVEANHSWGGYHWARTSASFTVKLGDNLSTGWKPYLATASSDWTQSTVLDTTIVAGGAKGNCRPTSGRVEVCNKSYGFNGWLGLAQIWITGGTHITQGAVKVNDSYFNLAQYNNPNEKQHVMCQEIGHTFGLGHTSEDGSTQHTCMDYSSDPTSTHPNQHDYDELATIYGHLDSFSTIGAAAAA